ncbi:unnamed protein product [Cuscuta campestris]|uniref:Uncharacterized protein n=1 Tax=Cuscuta campestris TaxID=132261 RepID=A0A484M1B7_9ASTE|nr:unnamed protein product [Cuscuta campestris]
MALLWLSPTSIPTAAAVWNSSSSSGRRVISRPHQNHAYSMLLLRRQHLGLIRSAVSPDRRKSQVVRMAPEEEKLTRRSPLEFPAEWERPNTGRRPDIFPQFTPMKTPLPPPLPADPPPEEDEEEEEKEGEEEDHKEDQEDPENEEEPELPERTQ